MITTGRSGQASMPIERRLALNQPGHFRRADVQPLSASISGILIGSSNLTHAAQTTGLEWSVRVSEARNRDVIENMSAVFEGN